MQDATAELLELKIAYLERANIELSDVLYRQQQELDRLRQQFQDLVSLRPQIQTMVANETSDSDAEATLIKQMQSSLDALKKTMDGNNKTFIACGGNSDFLSEGGAPFPG